MKWPVALRLGRVSNLPTVWTNVLAGLVLAGGLMRPARFVLLAGAISLLYVGGMYLNDAFDREIDRRQRPERPIPAGEVSARTVFAAGFGMLGAGVLLVAIVARGLPPVASPDTFARAMAPIASAAALALLIVLYDAYHKQNPLSPFVMGLCRVCVYTTAALCHAPTLGRTVIAGSAALLGYLIGLTYVARQENLTAVKNLWPLAFLALPFAYVAPATLTSPIVAAFYVGFLAWTVYALSFLLRREGRNIPKAVASLIAGISLCDALFVARQGRPVLAGACVVGFAATLFFQRFIRGT